MNTSLYGGSAASSAQEQPNRGNTGVTGLGVGHTHGAATGERRRMYLFERAYRDYGTRLGRAPRRLWSGCGKTWQWFWSGKGALGIEVALRIAVVLSGLGVGAWYVLFETSRGRGLSLGMLLGFCLIATYVGILMWGWKAPLHVAARALSGASAGGVVVALATVSLAAAMVIFSSYLAILFLLTALSFLVFLPTRAGQEAWLLYRRIAYVCPYDDCSYNGLPIHVCECGARYHDLLPSFYGIFYHTCRHVNRHVQLPTMDVFGRKKLPRLCGGCQRPLIHSSVGDVPVKPIAVVGGPSAGKTVFLRQGTRELSNRLSRIPDALAKIDSTAQQRDVQGDWALLDRGQVLAKTGGNVMKALGLFVAVPGRLDRCLLHLYDAPGEHFATMQQFGQKQVLSTLAGLVLLVDPFALPGLVRYGQQQAGKIQPSQIPLHQIVAVLLGGVNQFLVLRSTGQCAVPLAVVLNKADALPVADLSFLRGLVPADQSDDACRRAHDACRNALEKLGEGRSVRALEQKFVNVRYFACSALGRAADMRDTRPFQPLGVAEPLLWLLGLGAESRSASPAEAKQESR